MLPADTMRGRAAMLPALLSLAALTGCAGAWERSRERWYDHSTGTGPYSQWASCIEGRSRFYLDDPEFWGESDSQIFARVLGDCRASMAGSAWHGSERVRRLLSDAHRAVTAIRLQIEGDRADAITLETRN